MVIDEKSKPSEKLKAWYLFTEDFIAGTQHLTPLEVGCYVRLLCWNWNKRCKGIPDDALMHNRICSAHTEEEELAVGEVLNQFFTLIIGEDTMDNKWQNHRQLREWLYINNRIDNSRLNGKKGGRPRKNPEETPLPLPHTPTFNNNNMIKFENEIWSKIELKRGSKKRAFKEWDRLDNKIESSLIIKKYNQLVNNTTDKQYVPHLSSWISAERWEENLDLAKNKEEDYGIITRDPFRNLSFWIKGRKMPNDIDSDIEIMHKKGKISDEAMKQMGFSI